MNNTFNTLCLMTAALATVMPAAASAQDTQPENSKVAFSATLIGATDYVWRGFSQTDSDPAVFAVANLSAGGFYLGAETENVDHSGTSQEYDIWGGYAFAVGGAKLDLGFVRYGYVDASTGIDTLEFKAGLSGNLGKAGLGVTTYYTSDYFGSDNSATFTELSASHPVTDKLSASAAIGYQRVSNATHYTTWNVGLAYAVLPGVSITARYHDNDTDAFGDLGDARLVGSFSVSF